MVTVNLDDTLFVERVSGDSPIDLVGLHFLDAVEQLEPFGIHPEEGKPSNIYEVNFLQEE